IHGVTRGPVDTATPMLSVVVDTCVQFVKPTPAFAPLVSIRSHLVALPRRLRLSKLPGAWASAVLQSCYPFVDLDLLPGQAIVHANRHGGCNTCSPGRSGVFPLPKCPIERGKENSRTLMPPNLELGSSMFRSSLFSTTFPLTLLGFLAASQAVRADNRSHAIHQEALRGTAYVFTPQVTGTGVLINHERRL